MSSLRNSQPPSLNLGQEPVFINLRDVGMIDIDVSFSDTVFSVKEKIQQKFKIVPKYQRLFFGVHELEDCRILSYYGIQSYDAIDLVLKLAAIFDSNTPKYKLRLNFR